jgi:hypothetical protein
MRILGVFLAVLAIVGAFFFVPTGHPATYGRVTSPSWELIFGMSGNGRVIDSSRLWIQTIILGVGAFLCFRGEKTKSP